MKKSVLIPYERYETLLKRNEFNPTISKSFDQQKSDEDIQTKTLSNFEAKNNVPLCSFDRDMICACFKPSERLKVDNALNVLNSSPPVTVNSFGELQVGDYTLHGLHLTDIVQRMIQKPESSVSSDQSLENDSTDKDQTPASSDSIGTHKDWITKWRPLP